MNMTNRIRSALVAAVLVPLAASAAEPLGDNELYRWVDDDGQVFFNHTLPPERADKPYDIVNRDAVLLDRVINPLGEGDGDSELPPVADEEERQRRMDRMLLVNYRSEEDLMRAKRIELDQLTYDRKLVMTSYESLLTNYRGRIQEAAEFDRAGRPVPPDVRGKLDETLADIGINQRRQEELEARARGIDAEYRQKLARWRYLTTGEETG